MSYSHHARRRAILDAPTFALWTQDCAKILAVSRAIGIRLAGPLGTGEPVVRGDEVYFNGAEDCGHPLRSTGQTWPADTTVADRWCGGSCAHDSFGLDRTYETSGDFFHADTRFRDEDYATAFKPYDLTVTACLLMLAHRFGSAVLLSSDGDDEHWRDGQQLALSSCGIVPAIPYTIRRARPDRDSRSDSALAAAAFLDSVLAPPTDRVPTKTNRCFMRNATRHALFAELQRRGMSDREHRLLFATAALHRPVHSFTTLSEAEALHVFHALAER